MAEYSTRNWPLKFINIHAKPSGHRAYDELHVGILPYPGQIEAQDSSEPAFAGLSSHAHFLQVVPWHENNVNAIASAYQHCIMTGILSIHATMHIE